MPGYAGYNISRPKTERIRHESPILTRYSRVVEAPLDQRVYSSGYIASPPVPIPVRAPQYQDIGYERAPIVEQDDYFRKVVTYPGVSYEAPIPTQLVRPPSDGTWVRAVHYPVATDLYKQVPFKTDNITKTYAQAYPDVVHIQRAVPSSSQYDERPRENKNFQVGDNDAQIKELAKLLGDPNHEMVKHAKSIFAERNVINAEVEKPEFNYPHPNDVKKATNQIMNKIDFDNLLETSTKISHVRESDLHKRYGPNLKLSNSYSGIS